MTKIDRLTPEQEAYLPVFRAEHLDAALGGHRADRARLESAVADAYAEINKAAPYVIILQSPLQAMLAIKFMKAVASKDMGGQLWGQLGEQLGEQLREQLWGQLWGQLGEQLGEQLWGQLREQLWGQLGEQLGEQLGGQLGEQLWGQLGEQLGEQLWGQLGEPRYLWGAQDLYWIAWAKFAEHIGVNFAEQPSRRLEVMRRIGFECEWWWPYEGVCFCSERPISTAWDDQRRLHNETGPAVEYEEGFSIHVWHGVRVPAKWITDRASLTAKTALTWENIEQRRAACEILGWERILAELNALTINDSGDPEIGELVEVEIPDIGRERFLRVQCGTGRQFALPVPPRMQTAMQANAWTYGLDEAEFFKPEVRT